MIVSTNDTFHVNRECATFDGGINMCSYENHNQMLSKLQNLERRFPNLAKVGVVGNSAEGKYINDFMK